MRATAGVAERGGGREGGRGIRSKRKGWLGERRQTERQTDRERAPVVFARGRHGANKQQGATVIKPREPGGNCTRGN